jgi:hypothetical protein
MNFNSFIDLHTVMLLSGITGRHRVAKRVRSFCYSKFALERINYNKMFSPAVGASNSSRYCVVLLPCLLLLFIVNIM